VSVEQLLDDAGDVPAGPGVEGVVEVLLGQGGQAGQVARDRPGPLVEREQGLQGVREPVAVAALVGELELEGGVVLGDLADDPLVGQLLAGPGEGVAGGEFAGDGGVEAGVGQGGDEGRVGDGDAGAGPGDDLAEEAGAGGDRERGRGGRGHGRTP